MGQVHLEGLGGTHERAWTEGQVKYAKRMLGHPTYIHIQPREWKHCVYEIPYCILFSHLFLSCPVLGSVSSYCYQCTPRISERKGMERELKNRFYPEPQPHSQSTNGRIYSVTTRSNLCASNTCHLPLWMLSWKMSWMTCSSIQSIPKCFGNSN